MSRNFTILGPSPPPFGGVSIHVERLKRLLALDDLAVTHLSYTGFDSTRRLVKLRQGLKQWLAVARHFGGHRPDMIHVHYARLGTFLLLSPFILTVSGRWVVTFHSVKIIRDLQSAPAGLASLARRCLARFELVVCVRDEIRTGLRTMGVTDPDFEIMPAFLPPVDLERDTQRLPADLRQRLDADRREGRRSLCCGAYYLGAGYGKPDLYGVDLLVEALGRIGADRSGPLSLYVMVSNAPQNSEQETALAGIRRRAAELGDARVEIRFNEPMVPVMAACSLFVRPSREDGDSVAVREALALGVPVMASDVVRRPDACRLFADGDPDALARELALWWGNEEQPAADPDIVLSGDDAVYRNFVRRLAGGSND